MSPTLEAYMSGIIDRDEYISRRYAEETDAMVVNLRDFSMADGGGVPASVDLGDEVSDANR